MKGIRHKGNEGIQLRILPQTWNIRALGFTADSMAGVMKSFVVFWPEEIFLPNIWGGQIPLISEKRTNIILLNQINSRIGENLVCERATQMP